MERMTEERETYLTELAEEYGIDESIVFQMAEILGESEDYDGLVSSLEDYLELEFE